jgi:hypothetical protein
MGFETAASRKVTKKVRSPEEKGAPAGNILRVSTGTRQT